MKAAKAEADSLNKKRSEVVTVRLDPRLKYLAEIAARKQRRTLSGYIEWAVEQSLFVVKLREGEGYGQQDESVFDAQDLWDVDEAERIMRLAFRFPELLSYDEQLIWRAVRDNGFIWQGSYSATSGRWEWKTIERDLIWDRLRDHWDTFKGVAAGTTPKEELPAWTKFDPKAAGAQRGSSNVATTKSSDLDDEIPF